VQVLATHVGQKTEFAPKLTILRFALGGILPLYMVCRDFKVYSQEGADTKVDAAVGASLLVARQTKIRNERIRPIKIIDFDALIEPWPFG
jgi:hypothetical protein